MRAALPFFLLAYGLTWVLQTPAILALRRGEVPAPALMALMALGAMGPSFAALLLVGVREGRTGVRAALRMARPGPAWRWLLVALLMPLLLHLPAQTLWAATTGHAPSTWVFHPVTPDQVGIMLIAPLGEELGWRGYALPRMQRSMTPILASAVLGVLWSFWHLPTMLLPGASWTVFAISTVFVTALSVLIGYCFNRSGGFLRVAVLAHLGIHLDNVSRAHLGSDGLVPLVVTMVVTVAVALVVAVRAPHRASGAATCGAAA